MENIELELELTNLQKEIDQRLELRSELRQQLADLLCPFAVGERVQDKNGDKAEVARITWSKWSEGYEFFVKKIKKDGTPFVNESKIWNPEEWSKTE